MKWIGPEVLQAVCLIFGALCRKGMEYCPARLNVRFLFNIPMKNKSELAVKVGETVRRLRKEQKFSQEAFADNCEIHRTYMGSIERGEKVISIEIAKRLASHLGLSLSEFFAKIDDTSGVIGS